MIIGHRHILDFLNKSVSNNRLAHAYLFTGPTNLGKKTVALEFMRMLNGSEIDQSIHPDILMIEPGISDKEGKKREMEIGIEEIRKVQHQLSLFPYQSPYKIAMIDQAERMTAEASNCLLKTLEEPTNHSLLVLIAANSNSLLPTIISRCQLIKFLPVSEKEIEKGIKIDKQIIRLANGRPGLIMRYSKNPELLEEKKKIISKLEKLIKSGLNERYQYAEELSKDASQAKNILNHWLFWFRDLILLKSDCPDLAIYPESAKYHSSYSLSRLINVIKSIKRTNELLSNSSINSKLALEVLMLEF